MRGTIPATMRAARYDRYGASSVLDVRVVPVPAPGAGEALVRVHASGLNPKDPLVRSGGLGILSGRAFPRGTGFDFAGEVAALGAGVDDLAVGDRVWGFLDGYLGGAAAEYVAVPRRWLGRMPERLGWVEAAAIPLVGTTALQALRDRARLHADERLLVKGASGGVGTAAIQVAKARGAHVTALASGPGIDHCRAVGADEIVDYHRTDPTRLETRFDVFLDCIGGSDFGRWRRLLERTGRWVTTAPPAWMYPVAPLSPLLAPLTRIAAVRVVIVRPRTDDLDQLGRLVDAGAFRMPVMGTLPLERIAEAHDLVAGRHGRGKRVLVVSPAAAGNSS